MSLLFIGAGVEGVEGIARARRRGLEVVVTDGNPAAPGRALADAFIEASVYDAEATRRAVEAFPARGAIAGVLTVACDAPQTVAAVAGLLGLPGPSAETARLATHKLLMKERLAARGVPVPWFAPIDSVAQLERAVARLGRPAVLKPVDSRGARGVLRLDGGVDLGWAFEHARRSSPSGALLCEEFVAGPQLSTESVLWDGRAVLAGIADRNYRDTRGLYPYLIEDGGETPADLSDGDTAAIGDLAHAAGRALGLARGTVKGDVVIGPGGPLIIEVAVRLSGGYFCTHTIPLAFGVDPLDAAIAVALGEEPDWEALRPSVRQHVVNRFLFLPPGRVRAVRHDEALAREPWVKIHRVYAAPGDVVGPVSDHTKRGGTVLVTGETRALAIARAERAIRSIEVDIEPL